MKHSGSISDTSATDPAAERPDGDTSGHGLRSQLYRLGPLVALAVGVYGLKGSWDLSLGELTEPGPGLWPFLVAILVTGTSAVLVFTDQPSEYEAWTRATVRIGVGLVGLAVFIVLFEQTGFLLPAVLMLLFWLRVFAQEPWLWAIPLAVGGAVFLHLLFVEFFGVPFPEDIVPLPFGG